MLSFDDVSGIRVKICREAATTMLAHAQLAPDALEAGGVLLGRELVLTGDLVVDAVTTPVDKDIRTRTSFFRSGPSHQRRILEAWHQSQGSCGYLGEWHTHPETHPVPSNTDRLDWKRRLAEDTVDARFTLFLILGTRTLRAWLGDRRGKSIRALGHHEISR